MHSLSVRNINPCEIEALGSSAHHRPMPLCRRHGGGHVGIYRDVTERRDFSLDKLVCVVREGRLRDGEGAISGVKCMQSTAKQKCRHTFVHTSMHALSKKRGRKEAEATVASRMSHVACRMSSHVRSPETTKNSSSLPFYEELFFSPSLSLGTVVGLPPSPAVRPGPSAPCNAC